MYKGNKDFQHSIDYIAENLDIKYSVFYNRDKRYKFGITFVNKGLEPIHNEDWAIYFYHFHPILRVPQSSSKGMVVKFGKFKIVNINGDLYRLTPEYNFTSLQSGRLIKVNKNIHSTVS